MRILLILTLTLAYHFVSSQTLTKEHIKRLVNQHFDESLITLKDFLEIPNNGKDSVQVNNNVAWCTNQFESLGFQTTILYAQGVKHLFAERKAQKKTNQTVLFYLQIDGQPVDTSRWNQRNPFDPVLKKCDACEEIDWSGIKDWKDDWRIYARSASDSKGPATSFIEALKILKEQKIEPPYNIKVLMDFQEEQGSPTLPQLVQDNKLLLTSDAMLIMDGTRPPNNLPTLMFGARGISTLKITVFGAYKDLHSGQYGNFAPNPAFDLARLLASMKDENGKVLIPGFYEGVNLTDGLKKEINEVPENKEEMLSKLGLYQAEKIGDTYQEALQYPTLNIRGMQAGWINDQVRTIIPATATAELDMRLVPETPAERQIELVRKFIESKGFHIIDSLPTAKERATYPHLLQLSYRLGSKPFRTDLNSEFGQQLSDAMNRTLGKGNYIRMQSTGGSQPIAPFVITLGIPAISIRIANPDNNIHAPNENLSLGNFEEGIRMCIGILTQKLE
ncbi:MAG: M20/M25/M40 family metallo-hydrolase [Cyclobacteriaceae bacterium]|nr:M20/M25/M40 family metallo-hydrolase [Cyclobacteriaceae bacterium]